VRRAQRIVNLSLPGRRAGAAFILAVFAMVILVTLVTAFASLSQADIRLSANFSQHLQSLALCRTGVNLAMAKLAADRDTQGDVQTDSLTDGWAQFGGATGERIEFDTGWIRLEVVDASSRLNLNTAPRAALLLLPDLTDEVADSLLDWRDADSEPRESGAESDYYSALSPGYVAADAPFLSLEECRLVRGVTDELFFGALSGDTVTPGLLDLLTTHSGEQDLTAEGEPRLNANTADMRELRQRLGDVVEPQALSALTDLRARGGLPTLGQLLAVDGWRPEMVAAAVDNLTLGDQPLREGTVNLNTASDEVLATLPGMTDELRQALVDQRQNEPLANVGEVIALDESGVSFFRQSADLVATKSAYFLVEVAAGVEEDGAPQLCVSALLRRTSDAVELVYWRETDSRVLRKGWKWTV